MFCIARDYQVLFARATNRARARARVRVPPTRYENLGWVYVGGLCMTGAWVEPNGANRERGQACESATRMRAGLLALAMRVGLARFNVV